MLFTNIFGGPSGTQTQTLLSSTVGFNSKMTVMARKLLIDLPGSAPGFLANQASVLLLNYRSLNLEDLVGFEPT